MKKNVHISADVLKYPQGCCNPRLLFLFIVQWITSTKTIQKNILKKLLCEVKWNEETEPCIVDRGPVDRLKAAATNTVWECNYEWVNERRLRKLLSKPCGKVQLNVNGARGVQRYDYHLRRAYLELLPINSRRVEVVSWTGAICTVGLEK